MTQKKPFWPAFRSFPLTFRFISEDSRSCLCHALFVVCFAKAKA
jgi:hypothetical protein